jgi:hypothetical protein
LDLRFNYNLSFGNIIENLVINVGGSDLLTVHCANHKLNLAVRTSIALHPLVSSHFKKLNAFCSKIRNSIDLNNVFKEAKCRLRLENATRWGSAFLLLELFLKANDLNLFTSESETLPVSISTIQMYYDILKHLYLTNIQFQSNKSSIGDVIPNILICLNKLAKLKTKKNILGKQFIDLLIDQLRNRFDYELNSKIYQVKLHLFTFLLFLTKG